MKTVSIYLKPHDFASLANYAQAHDMNKTADLIQYADRAEPLKLPAFIVTHLLGLLRAEGLNDSRLALILAYDLQN